MCFVVSYDIALENYKVSVLIERLPSINRGPYPARPHPQCQIKKPLSEILLSDSGPTIQLFLRKYYKIFPDLLLFPLLTCRDLFIRPPPKCQGFFNSGSPIQPV